MHKINLRYFVIGIAWIAQGCFSYQSEIEYCENYHAFVERCQSLRNDLLIATYYCGSDEGYHHFVIARRYPLGIIKKERLSLVRTCALPFPIVECVGDDEHWRCVDDQGRWLSGDRPTLRHRTDLSLSDILKVTP